MKILSLSEFRDFINEHGFKKIIIASCNQSWYSLDSTVDFDLEFDEMIIIFNPNTIFLRNGKNSMRIKKIRSIKLHEDDCILGNVFDIICGDSYTELNNKEYTLIIR